MGRTILSGLGAAVMCLTSPVFATQTDWPTVVEEARKQIPRLEILREGAAKPGVCSGVVINADDGYLLTAAHCVEVDKAKNVAITANGRHAAVEKVNVLLDMAVLKFQVRGEKTITLAPKSPVIGAEVAVLGYAFGIEDIAVQFGRVAQTFNNETKLLWLNVDLIFGDSGGGAIDANGRLVGLSSTILYKGPAHLAAAVPIEKIRDFVEKYLPKPEKK